MSPEAPSAQGNASCPVCNDTGLIRASPEAPEENCPLPRHYLVPKLRGYASQLYVRFGGAPVYLVGSALRKEHPNDVDVTIVMTDEAFIQRYGVWHWWHAQLKPGDWEKVQPLLEKDRAAALSGIVSQFWLGVWHPWERPQLAWGREVAKVTRNLHGLCEGYAFDVKVMSDSHVEKVHDKPRLRLDAYAEELAKPAEGM